MDGEQRNDMERAPGYRLARERFFVIGKEGSTAEGEGFIGRLWESANAHFDEVAQLAKRDAQGNLAGIWGAMSDMSRAFDPWEDGFSRGLYLAGVECDSAAQPPQGWTKWTIPGYVYLVVKNGEGAFERTLAWMRENGVPLAGAVHEYTDPRTGEGELYFPIEKK